MNILLIQPPKAAITMETLAVDGLSVYFPAEERTAAELVRQACAASITLMRDSWGLGIPEDVRVYVVPASWLPALFHAAPWRWRPLLVVARFGGR